MLENIILGHPRAGRILNLKRAEDEIMALSDRYGFKIDLRAKVWQISEGEKQLVEILKALYRGAKVLILDEPTSALTPIETEVLMESIMTMSSKDMAIVPFITHKLPIVLAISERVTVLRRGKVVSRMATADSTEKSLAREMVGRDVIFRVERKKVEQGDPIIEVENVFAKSDKDVMAVDGMSFTIHAGEIFGIAGISGNGQRELVEVIAGLRKEIDGKITLDGVDFTKASALDRWRAGIGYIPADRIDVGSIGDFSLIENVMMNYYFDPEYSSGGTLDYKRIRELTDDIIEEFNVATPSAETTAKSLSGGNLQKVILGRVLSRKPRLVIADLPSQGLDVGATEFIRNKLIEAKQNNACVILISEDLDEILSMSDWVAPVYEGKIMGILPGEEAKREDVGAMMAGLTIDGEAS